MIMRGWNYRLYMTGSLLLSIALFTGGCSSSSETENKELQSRYKTPADELPQYAQDPKKHNDMFMETNKAAGDTIRTISGLQIVVKEKGTGKKVESGMNVKVDYAGYLADGTLFDTSIESVAKEHNYSRGPYPFEPIEFLVGAGKVIRGWDEGLTTDMYVGGRRRLIIPPALGYGSRGAPGAIPPNATLIFDVHMVSAEAE